jgi:hypothetical protein
MTDQELREQLAGQVLGYGRGLLNTDLLLRRAARNMNL